MSSFKDQVTPLAGFLPTMVQGPKCHLFCGFAIDRQYSDAVSNLAIVPGPLLFIVKGEKACGPGWCESDITPSHTRLGRTHPRGRI